MTIERLRHIYGLTQKTVAELSDVPLSVVRNFEQGRPVSEENIKALNEFADRYDMYAEDMHDELRAHAFAIEMDSSSPLFTIADEFSASDLAPKGFGVWQETMMNDETRYVIMYGAGPDVRRLIVRTAGFANFLGPVIKTYYPKFRVVVGKLERTDEFYDMNKKPFRWNEFKAFGTHPNFYDSVR